MIVVVTDDFALYHAAVGELRDRAATFTTAEPGDPLPERTRVVVSAAEDKVTSPPGVDHVTTTADDVTAGVDEALGILRADDGRTVVGVDPGERPGIAVLSGETVVTAHHVPVSAAAETIREAVADEPDALVRIGDGARLHGARLVEELEAVAVELVDETGTTPSLGRGATGRGLADVLAAVNIARMDGESVETRDLEPTAGEIQRIKNRSREVSDGDRTLDTELARRVALGELDLSTALAEHRRQ